MPVSFGTVSISFSDRKRHFANLNVLVAFFSLPTLAVKWDLSGINVWFFPRTAIPSDVSGGSPDPSSWGTPVANFPSTDCSPYEFFYDHFSIFDTTLCGDWAGASSVWDYAGYAGQDTSCAASTGYSTCESYVRAEGAAFSEAYWEIGYVAYYNSTTQV